MRIMKNTKRLGEESRRTVQEGTDIRLLTTIFGPERRIRRRLHNNLQLEAAQQNLHNSSANILSSNQNRMSWVRQVAPTRAKRNTHRILAGKPEEK
jgi:hypothetical protein